jgi:hypothetical protein
MTVDQQVLSNPELRQRVIEYAVDSLWSMLESNSVPEEDPDGLDGDEEWMDLGTDADKVAPEVLLLAELGLLGRHPTHPEWVREIATL